MRFKTLNIKKQHSFKDRKIKNKTLLFQNKYFTNFQIPCIYTKKQLNFEFFYFKLLRSTLKILLQYKYSIFKKIIIYFNLLPNFPISLKNKNIRMGKGIGRFARWVFKLKAFCILIAFNMLSHCRLKFIRLFIKIRISQFLEIGGCRIC